MGKVSIQQNYATAKTRLFDVLKLGHEGKKAPLRNAFDLAQVTQGRGRMVSFSSSPIGWRDRRFYECGTGGL